MNARLLQLRLKKAEGGHGHMTEGYAEERAQERKGDPEPLVRAMYADLFPLWGRGWPPPEQEWAGGFGLAVLWAAGGVYLTEWLQVREVRNDAIEARRQDPRYQAWIEEFLRRCREARKRGIPRGARSFSEALTEGAFDPPGGYPPATRVPRGRGAPQTSVVHVGRVLMVEFLARNDLPAPGAPGDVLRLRKTRKLHSKNEEEDRPTSAADAVALAAALYRMTLKLKLKELRPVERFDWLQACCYVAAPPPYKLFFCAAQLLALVPRLKAVEGIAEEAVVEAKSILKSEQLDGARSEAERDHLWKDSARRIEELMDRRDAQSVRRIQKLVSDYSDFIPSP